MNAHDLSLALEFHVFVYLTLHASCDRSLFLGIGKATKMIKTLFEDEILEQQEIFIGLARKAYHDRGSYGEAWNAFAQLAEDRAKAVPRDIPVHLLQQGIACMLNGDIEVFDDFRMGGKEFDEFIADVFWIDVEQSNPLDAFDLDERFQEFK